MQSRELLTCSGYTGAVIIISVSEQMLYHRRKTGVIYAYPVSTATNGTGNQSGSFQTPLGRHRIAEKIGHCMPLLTAFSAREPFCIYDPQTDNPNQDWILTRILWLKGCETGKNRRGKVDTHARYIYIHGTHEEDKIGNPASHGCIRMRNEDMLELFEHVAVGESVRINNQ
ncbi:putative L,D-transpeptidase YbiS precursor [Mariprofundus micogutta]|uniref:Putative L,D-transpeptidase YbiS n=1 Tax=Mariprofundus micogutta TaxID=1921010 RepID=A0A1L8CJW3_9PROT|nr:L,D-transpeptidase [Mariprofundus micogutta]GAV19214.1 putative L,D-transpeptidase YbiS precursor [Mariprofundus micogutta]